MVEDFRVPSRNQTNDLHWDTRTPGELGHFTRFFTQSFPLAQLAPQYKFYSMLNINTIWKVLEIFASQKQLIFLQLIYSVEFFSMFIQKPQSLLVLIMISQSGLNITIGFMIHCSL